MAKAKNKPVKKGVAKGSQSANLKNTPHTDEFMDEIVQKHEELQTTGAGGNFFSMKKAGDYELRLITFEDKDGKKHLFAPYMSHFIKRANKSFNCLGGVKSCPICRYIAWVEFKEGTQTDFTKNAKAREKFYVNAL